MLSNAKGPNCITNDDGIIWMGMPTTYDVLEI